MGGKRKINKYWYVLIGVFLIIAIISIPLILSMGGDIKTTGSWSEETSESLSCKARNVDYEYFGEDKATSSNNVRVNAIFNNGRLASINLVRKMTYIDADIARIWSDAHEGNMNKKFAEDGLGAYALNANYSKNESTAQMSLYATSSEINNTTIKYFMLDNLPKDIDGYKKGYSDKGFTCEFVKGNK